MALPGGSIRVMCYWESFWHSDDGGAGGGAGVAGNGIYGTRTLLRLNIWRRCRALAETATRTNSERKIQRIPLIEIRFNAEREIINNFKYDIIL